MYISKIERVKEINKKIQLELEPKLDGYSHYEILNAIENGVPYIEQLSLFGDVPKHIQVYEEYEKMCKKYSTSVGRLRNTAKKFKITPTEAESFITQRQKELKLDRLYRIKLKCKNYSKKEIADLEKLEQQINRRNHIRCHQKGRLSIIINYFNELQHDYEINNNLDVVVRINYKGLENTKFRNIVLGPLKFLSTLMTKQDFMIALVNDRVEVTRGNIEAYKNIEFTGHEKKRKTKCDKCGKEIDYNIIGANKKLGYKTKYFCVDCLGITQEQYFGLVEQYKRTGCNMFI